MLQCLSLDAFFTQIGRKLNEKFKCINTGARMKDTNEKKTAYRTYMHAIAIKKFKKKTRTAGNRLSNS